MWIQKRVGGFISKLNTDELQVVELSLTEFAIFVFLLFPGFFYTNLYNFHNKKQCLFLKYKLF